MEAAYSASATTKSQAAKTRPGFAIPILLVVFNRPETTKVVFESIRTIGPDQLYVAADGPRSGVEGEQDRCLEARQLATAVDWKCRLQTRFREQNAGLAVSMSEAISWFFENVDCGIILEDDCVPAASFYRFCEELLHFYRDVPEVMHISGDNFQYGRKRGEASYYFSKYAHCWGWATWRRAWQRFGFQEEAGAAPPTVWARHWQLTLERYGGASILPNVNLVTNIGFGAGATHTLTRERYSYLPTSEIDFPLVYPTQMVVDTKADLFTYYSHYRNVPRLDLIWLYRLWDSFYSMLKRVKRRLLRQGHR
jgi:glycosyltransferase involved in cell wall biosynthesis